MGMLTGMMVSFRRSFSNDDRVSSLIRMETGLVHVRGGLAAWETPSKYKLLHNSKCVNILFNITTGNVVFDRKSTHISAESVDLGKGNVALSIQQLADKF